MTLLTLLAQKPPPPPPPQVGGPARFSPRDQLSWPAALVIACVIVAVLIAAIRFGTTLPSEPISPWAEDNQGLLSLMALVIALFFAVYENRRALRADDNARREYIAMAVDLIDTLIAATDAAQITDAAGDPQRLEKAWVVTANAERQAIGTAKHVILRDALLASEMHRLDYVLGWGIRTHNETGISTAQQMADRLRTIRKAVLARR